MDKIIINLKVQLVVVPENEYNSRDICNGCFFDKNDIKCPTGKDKLLICASLGTLEYIFKLVE